METTEFDEVTEELHERQKSLVIATALNHLGIDATLALSASYVNLTIEVVRKTNPDIVPGATKEQTILELLGYVVATALVQAGLPVPPGDSKEAIDTIVKAITF